MKTALFVSLAVVASAGAGMVAQSRQPAAGSIKGVWKIAEVVTTGAGAETVSSPQPSLVIFTTGHYSYLSINGSKPRSKVTTGATPTDAEKLAKFEEWNSFTANGGTYAVQGTTLTRRPTIAKNESVMSNPPVVDQMKLEGNTLWLTSKSPAGQPPSETRRKLVRVE
jgi:hypothetical protein